MKYLLHIAFDGLCFHGTQRQNNAKTVQGELEKILTSIYDSPIDLECCSRLDSDVSAMDFVCAFKPLDSRIDKDRLSMVISGPFNGTLRVKSVEEVDDDFSPRYNAHSKTYLYAFDLKGEPFLQSHTYAPPKNFDRDLYERAMGLFVGEYDFRLFSSKDDRKDPNETFHGVIDEVRIEERDGLLLTYIRGPYFNRYQIRFMVGAAVYVACGLEPVESIKERLSGVGDTDKPRFKAPGKALILYKVDYSHYNNEARRKEA